MKQTKPASIVKQIQRMASNRWLFAVSSAMACLFPVSVYLVSHFEVITTPIVYLTIGQTRLFVASFGSVFSGLMIYQTMKKLGGNTIASAVKAFAYTVFLEIAMILGNHWFSLMPLLAIVAYNAVGYSDLILNSGSMLEMRKAKQNWLQRLFKRKEDKPTIKRKRGIARKTKVATPKTSKPRTRKATINQDTVIVPIEAQA